MLVITARLSSQILYFLTTIVSLQALTNSFLEFDAKILEPASLKELKALAFSKKGEYFNF